MRPTFSLPPNTPTAIGSTAARIREFPLDQSREILGSNGARIIYDKGLRRLIVKLPSRPHEVAHRFLEREIEEQTLSKNLKRRYLNQLPAGRSRQWPTVVIECGYSESTTYPREMAGLWISSSDGQRPCSRILVKKWILDSALQMSDSLLCSQGQSSVREQQVSIIRNQDSSAAEMFLRAPAPPVEQDHVLSEQDFRGFVQDVWEEMELSTVMY
ncbi:hypothetical protein BDW59DRAFT_171077 [Aspergillus cavernicola]|uniref:Uncharacterized protein n=1 Tax=Aspergillus cavernicola TaxID=176166 RepID=A0ABR4IKI8_9EURO